jgi:AAHS family cis,cis-muconate transporter-like MFS transporter
MAASGSLDRTAKLVIVAVFLALLIDGMDSQMLALSLPSISKELRLSTILAGALGTYTFLGMGIGGVLAGWLSDRVGRARVVWWAVLTFSGFTSVIAWTHTYQQIAWMRLLCGFGTGAAYSTAMVLAAEYTPTRVRGTILGTVQAGFSIGYICAAVLSSYLMPHYGWRALFRCAMVPGVITLWLLWGVPDSPGWSTTQQRATNRVSTFRTMWGEASVRRTFLLWTLAAIALQFGYYGANTWLPSYLMKDIGVSAQSAGWYVAGAYTMAVISKIVTGWLGDVIGRRVVWTVSGLAAAVYLPFLVHAATTANIALLLLIFGLLYGAPYGINATYMNESFPDEVRGTAVGTAYSIGRIGSTLSPLFIGMAASHHSIGLGLALLGISYAACALIPGLLIREKMYDPGTVSTVASASDPELAGPDGVVSAAV